MPDVIIRRAPAGLRWTWRHQPPDNHEIFPAQRRIYASVSCTLGSHRVFFALMWNRTRRADWWPAAGVYEVDLLAGLRVGYEANPIQWESC